MLKLASKLGKSMGFMQPKALNHSSSFNFSVFHVENPYTLETYCEFNAKTEKQAEAAVQEAYHKFRTWRSVSLDERIKVLEKSAEYFEQNLDQIAKDITCQMGKPITQSKQEINLYLKNVKELTKLAPEALQETVVRDSANGIAKYRREPVGVVLSICPWNYPVTTCGNILIPSILSGNAVAIKHSPYTPLIGQHFVESFKYAGAENLVVDVLMSPKYIEELYNMPEIGFVAFTGSVQTGRVIQEDISDKRFINMNLELGGNDAAYVADDADLDRAVKDLMFSAFYNSGQSCNSTERIYVHESLYQDFLDKAVKEAEKYQMGDPILSDTTLGPMCLPDTPAILEKQVEEAAGQGGTILIGGFQAQDSAGKGRFFPPTIVSDAENDMEFMMLESFGTIVGIQSTVDDEEAIKLINDDQYGLSSVIYSANRDRIEKVGSRLKVGTVYGNRVLAQDPLLPWSGKKNTGKGVSLSKYGFDMVTLPKAFNIKF